MGRRTWAWLIAGSLLSGQALAGPSARLDYRREAGLEACPDEAALRQAVSERLGYDPFFRDAEQTIVAKIARDAGELRGEVQLLDAAGAVRGSRELRSASTECAELVSRMALAISIAVDPSSLDRPPPSPEKPAQSEQPSDTAPAEKAAQEAPAKPEASPAPVPARPPRLMVEQQAPIVVEVVLGAVVSTGFGPGPGAGPLLGVGLRRGLVSLALEARYQVVKDLPVGGGRVESSLTEGALIGCLRPSVAMLCGELGVSRLAIEGKDIGRPGVDSTWIPRVGPRLGADLPLSGALWARFQLGALVALSRPHVVFEGATVWDSPALGGFGSLSLLGRFP